MVRGSGATAVGAGTQVGAAGTRSAVERRNRRPPGDLDATGRTAVRRPIASSPGYGRGGGYDRNDRGGRYRAGYSERYRYGYGRRGVRYAGHYRSFGRHYYPNRFHVYYPGYVRPQVYGSFFYFPGYSFGVGYGYPSAFGHYGYSGYAHYPYGYGGYYSNSYADPYTGFLRLKVRPRDAQVFVDGYYVGLVDHFDGWAQRLRLEEGNHHVEIQHPAYLPMEFEVLIVTGEKVTFEERMVPR